MLASNIVYQGSPLGATVIPNGKLFFTTLPSVMVPESVILATLPLVLAERYGKPCHQDNHHRK